MSSADRPRKAGACPMRMVVKAGACPMRMVVMIISVRRDSVDWNAPCAEGFCCCCFAQSPSKTQQSHGDPKHIEGSKERCLLGQNTAGKCLDYSSLSSYKMTLNS